ncbi:CPBP family glutamic-type intramembrane protease [Winogradskyella costae]|uniref:CPBP family glutamic-type intramembrane protease n=1 Tax=Winogradskyella costae TaxID=2697008 RepID=UPI0015CE1577|nr:CPBP family glutamic-type intramembrane protease [Winogradskyella costae]
MREFIKKYEIWVYLVLAPISGVIFVKARVHDLISASVYANGRFVMLLLLLMSILIYTKGTKGIINLFKPMLNWKVHPKWYFLALLFPTTIAVIALLLKSFYYSVDFTAVFSFESYIFKAYLRLLVWSFLGEVVWVSYSIGELSKKTKPFYAGQIVAVFWGLWFVPVILFGEGIFPDIPLVSSFIFRFGSAGLCALIYSRTKSGICVLILQSAVNFTLISFPIIPTRGGAPTYTAFAVIYFVIMLGLWGLDYLIKKKNNKESITSELVT